MLETKSLKNVPIFAAGTWTASGGSKTKWTTAMLDQIVTNAKTLSKRVIPFLRLDHTDEKTQKRITGRFKIGDLENVRRVGKQLVVDIVRIPKKAYDLMEAGVFGRPSAEIWPAFKDEATGKNAINVLSGAAVLSGTHPAVTTLDQIRDLFESEPAPEWEIATFETEHDEAVCFYDLAFEEEKETHAEPDKETTTEPSTGGEDVTKEEVTQMIEEANKKAFSKINEALGIDESADAVKAIEELQSGKTELETKIAEQEKAEFKSQVDALLLEATKACKVTPALEPTLRLSFDGQKIEEIKATLEGLPAIPGLKFEESASEGDPADGKGGEAKVVDNVPEDVKRYSEEAGYQIDAESVETDAKIKEVMKKDRVSYGEAYQEVTGEHIDITPNEGANVVEDKR